MFVCVCCIFESLECGLYADLEQTIRGGVDVLTLK